MSGERGSLVVPRSWVLHIVDCYFQDPEVEADAGLMEQLAKLIGYPTPNEPAGPFARDPQDATPVRGEAPLELIGGYLSTTWADRVHQATTDAIVAAFRAGYRAGQEVTDGT